MSEGSAGGNQVCKVSHSVAKESGNVKFLVLAGMILAGRVMLVIEAHIYTGCCNLLLSLLIEILYLSAVSQQQQC